MFRTHYDNLQVKADASNEVIRSAYKALSQKYHPDRNPGKVEECTRIMAIINKAYYVLSDPALRAEHDAWIKQQNAGHDTTEAMAGVGRPRQDQPQPDGQSSMRSRAGTPPSSSGGFSQSWKDLRHGQARANKAAAQEGTSQQHDAKENASATAKAKKPMTLPDLFGFCVLGGWSLTNYSPEFFRYSGKDWYQLIFNAHYLGLLAGYTAMLMGAAICTWLVMQLLQPMRRFASPIALGVICVFGFFLFKANLEKVFNVSQKAVAVPLESPSLTKPGPDEFARKYNEAVMQLEAQHSELNQDSASEFLIDPEKYVLKNGYHFVEAGDNGKTPFYSFTERTSTFRLGLLEAVISNLPKDPMVLGSCDSMRGGIKAMLIQQRGIAVDVAVINYGYSGATIVCILKYMHQNTVGTQVVYLKKGAKGTYMVFVTD